MKINSITINNFLAIKEVRIDTSAPVTLIAGHNGAGKSSVAEAVRHAMTGEAERVSLKKEYGALMHDGAAAGFAVVETSEGEFGILLPAGKQTGAEPHFAMPYCLDPARFAAMSGSERRAFLFKLMGIKITKDAVRARLLERGVDEANADEILQHLANGFEASHKEAQAKARDAKAAWRVITGETYGEKKAEVWAAPVPKPTEDDDYNDIDFEHLQQQIEEASAEMGRLEADAKHASSAHAQRAEADAKLAALRDKAGKYARIRDKLNRDEDDLAEWERKVAEAQAAASGKKSGAECNCPECGASLVFDNGKLEAWANDAPDTEIAAKLPQYIEARDLLARSVANGKRDLAEADAAAKQIDAIEATLGEKLPDIEACKKAIEEQRAKLDSLREQKSKADAVRREREQFERDVEQAKRKTKEAADHHREVKAWEAIADALSPDGIPAEFLAEALAPFNARLAEHSGVADWPQVEIDGDMNVIVGGRPYALRSESEKWRADAMIAAAIADISGLCVILLDRFDVLDLEGRGEAINWLGYLADEGLVETALVFGTLKSKPAGLPDYMQALWIDCGEIVEQ